MKIFRVLLIATLVAGLSSCATSSSIDTATTTTIPTTTTTTVATPNCSQDALDGAVGERETWVMGCASGWASLQPRSWECGEHCFAFIYKWDQAKWNLVMKCDQYSALSADGFCSGMSGEIRDAIYTETITEFPPQDVVCQIWAKSFYAEFEENNGCV